MTIYILVKKNHFNPETNSQIGLGRREMTLGLLQNLIQKSFVCEKIKTSQTPKVQSKPRI